MTTEPSGTGGSLQLGDAGNGRSPLGTTRVANEVVASIAALAALQVPGVHAMYHPGSQPINIVRRSQAHRGVRVELVDDALRLDMFIVMEAGGSVPAVGAEIQRRVVDAVDRMLDLRVAEANIFVSEVVFT